MVLPPARDRLLSSNLLRSPGYVYSPASGHPPADLALTHGPFVSSVRPSEQAEPDLPRPRECAYDGCTRAGKEPARGKDVPMRMVCRFPGRRLTS